MYCFIPEEGHLVATLYAEPPINFVIPSLETLIKADSKGKFGVEDLGYVEILDADDYTPMTFHWNGWYAIPFKNKADSLLAAKSAEILGIQAHALALRSVIDRRNNKLFVTRQLTYYLFSKALLTELKNDKYTRLLRYIYAISPDGIYGADKKLILPNINDTEFISQNLDKIFQPPEGLTPNEHIRYCEIISYIRTIYFSVLDTKYLDI